jgi:ABC-type bacteriocin/lantibiotic exporter with double-glycine peptidase domain
MEINDFITRETVTALIFSIFLFVVMLIMNPRLPIVTKVFYSILITLISCILAKHIVKLIDPRKRY